MEVGDGRFVCPQKTFRHLNCVLDARSSFNTHPFRNTLVPLDENHFARIGVTEAAPIPHVECMDAVIGVFVPIQVDVSLVGSERRFKFALHLPRVAGLREDEVPEVNVTRMVLLVEAFVKRMSENQNAALAKQRFADGHQVEQVASREAVNQDGVHDAVDIVGTKVGSTAKHDVALPLDRDFLLLG
ncbi:MAG: hypothetical protein EORIYHIE_002679, partial [Candidatus Fervidibacter sp.]